MTDRSPPAPSPAARGTGAAFAALVLGSVMLAFGPWFVRLADVGPMASGFWRLALALPVLAVAAASGARDDARPRGWPWLVAAAGVSFAFDLGAWHAGILHTRLANATLFGNVASFFFAAYGFLVARRWPSCVQAGALLLAAAGVALLMGRSYQLSRDHLGGDLLCLLAGLFYAAYMIAVSRLSGMRPRALLFWATLCAAAALLPLVLLIEPRLWPHLWWPLVALAAGSQLAGQGLLVVAIRALPPLIVGLGLLIQPVVAAAIGWSLYGERLTASDLLGAAAIAAALLLVRGRRADRA